MYRDIFSKYPEGTLNNNSNILGKYYLNFKPQPKTLNRLISTFDENGIPLNNAYIDVKNPKLHYYPISIGQYGLSIFHAYLDNSDNTHKAHFLRIANWFYDNASLDERLGAYWLTDVDKPEFQVFEPWKSAFSQSRALSILLRAWQITKDQKYFDLAKKALIPYEYSITEGGVRAGVKKNDAVYEEYVASEPTRILDGAIFSLFGLNDAVRAFEKIDFESYEKAKSLFDDGIMGLIHWLPKYDMGYWFFYNRCEIEGYPTNDPCTINYLKLVSVQLEILHSITGEKTFKEYVEKFRRYQKPQNIVKMYIEKYKALKKLNRL